MSLLASGQKRKNLSKRFFQELAKASTQPAILSLLPDHHVPATQLQLFQSLPQSLYDPVYQSLGFVSMSCTNWYAFPFRVCFNRSCNHARVSLNVFVASLG